MEVLFTVLLLGLLFMVTYLLLQLRDMKQPKEEDQTTKLLFQQLNDMNKTLHDGLSKQDQKMMEQTKDMSSAIQKQFGASQKLVQGVTEEIAKIQQTNKQVVGFAEQMQSLENILKNPKHRGVLGEYFLETMLSEVFPPGVFQMQYKFKNGEIVDAVIFIQEQIIPIDSKFSLEKFNQIMQETDKDKRSVLEKEFKADVKGRIDETSKYVRPEENTTDFAFMYIPAEGIYHSLLGTTVGVNVNAQSLIEYAHSKGVTIVSPSSFLAYLQTVQQGLRQFKMAEGITEIKKNVLQLDRHIKAYDEYFGKLGKHLSTTVTTYNCASKELKKIDKDVYKITDGEAGGEIEVLELEKPVVEV
jgi:DNA recombination protein RmuC